VGDLLASRLGWSFLDLDEEIERRTGRSIADVFADEGEAEFRVLEARITAESTPPAQAVIASGGGWMARPELRDEWPDAIRVWLEVRPDTALARLGSGRASRPLLSGPDSVGRLKSLLEKRLPSYALAEYRVVTDGLKPDEVVDEILSMLPERWTKGSG
jgi:shikimate kinase